MNSAKNLMALLVALCLTACASAPTDFEPVGGSRSHGVVYLSYEHGVLSGSEPDYAAGQATARERCKAWGYSGAERFSTSRQRCRDGLCWVYVVTIPYQCTGPRI